MTPPADTAPGLPSAKHILLVLLVCALVYWPLLGATGFSSSEGHRVIPAWEMLESGDFLVTRMFEQIYVRKPPGMPWAITLSSSIFGQTEFAARAVSAASMTALALLSAFFAARWFGRPWGLWGGLAAALTPILWSTGRAAEIEALNNFATAAAAFLLIDMLIHRRPDRASQLWTTLAAAAAITLAALAKGPAGFTTIGAAIIASCIVLRSASPLRRPSLWAAAAIPALLLGALFLLIQRAVEHSGQPPVVENVSNFLWAGSGLSLKSVTSILVMGPEAIAAALPASLVLLFVWRSSATRNADDRLADQAARATALTCLLSVGLLTAAGVHNSRYALPAVVVLPVLVGYVARGSAGAFENRRRGLARALLPACGLVWLIVLLVGAAVYIGWYQHDRRLRSSGLQAGIALAPHLPDGAVVWADQLIEARPEVLLYARRAAAADGRHISMRWIPGFASQHRLPPPGAYLAVRNDAGSNELEALHDIMHRLEPITEGRVHKFDFMLFRIADE